MAQQDKTDWYWNGVLAGAVNNLYYDFINVDVVHVPYASTHRNSSFFLQTRRSYTTADIWDTPVNNYKSRDVVDIKYIWDDKCNKSEGTVYILLADKGRNRIRVHRAKIENGCVGDFDWTRTRVQYDINGCGALKLFTTNYVRGESVSPGAIKEDTGKGKKESKSWGIQINKYEGGKTHGLFSETNVENGSEKFQNYSIGWYILVYESQNRDGDGFAGQVRMITGKEGERLTVDAPWQGFKTLTSDDKDNEVKGGGLSYKIFKEWGEVLGYTEGNKIYIMPNKDSAERVAVYDQRGVTSTKIISVAEATEKIFVLTDNGYIHYSNYVGHDKFFIQDDAFAGVDKTSIAAYRDMIIAFGNKHIAVGIPDENNTYTTMYNQSSTVGLWSRYSYAEYDGDLVFVSNDKRLLALEVASNVGKYMLQYQDVGDSINSKLSVLTPTDEIYIGTDGNDLRIFLQTKSKPYYRYFGDWRAHLTDGHKGVDGKKVKELNAITRIIKFDKQFKVWTEDLVQGILLQGIEGGIYFGESGLYQRSRGDSDWKGDGKNTHFPFKTYISAYLIENESDWVGGTSSWLASRPKLYNVAKLNRLITTLGPGIYSHDSKIKITSYVKGLGSVYEFSMDGGNNDWLGLVTTKYLGEKLSPEEERKIDCMLSVLKDNQKAYQPKCEGEKDALVQNLLQTQPWCTSYDELITFDKGVCINDSLYEIAPTMPLTTKLGENQNYATQIKLELEGGVGDIITFGGWLGELFIAPLFTIGPDGEYQLQPNTDC